MSARRQSSNAGLARDFALGGAVVFIFSAALAMFLAGCGGQPFNAGRHCFFPALLGVLAGAIFKWIYTGCTLTPGEVFRNFFFTGILAASASNLTVWQAPSDFSDLARLSPLGSAVFCLLYHVANFQHLRRSQKHLPAIEGAAITAIPFAAGLPLALQSGNFGGSGGRILLLFLFNELVVQIFSLTTRRRLLTSAKAHGWILLATVAVIAAPEVAEFGSGTFAAGLPAILKPFLAILTTVISQGALWAEVFLATGILIDGIRGRAPTTDTILDNAIGGMKKGMVFSGVLMGVLQLLNTLSTASGLETLQRTVPMVLYIAGGALAFPFCKAAVETFDGSYSFFRRVALAYLRPALWARGAVAGLGAGLALNLNLAAQPTRQRIAFGLAAGVIAYAGVSILRDLIYGAQKTGGLKTWRVYLVEGALGGFVGAAFAFYFDTAQLAVVADKLALYGRFGMPPATDEFYPLVSKWGHIQLGTYCGGAKLLFNEALKGVIGWGVAAWLFAINRALLAALFERQLTPVRRIFSADGIGDLTEGTIFVLRWGLWMAPIIFTFLKQMHAPTWYNQDGAVHTLFCAFNSATMSADTFAAWSLKVFMWVLAFDFFRVLIWLDHMGLRVATLVNLSFLGMDKLDEKFARFIGRDAAGRFIPEGVKRFTTWAPLLIPFYIPAGKDWDWAWTNSETIQRTHGSLAKTLLSLSPGQIAFAGLAGIVLAGLVSFCARKFRARSANCPRTIHRLANLAYAVEWKQGGEITSTLTDSGFDVTRRAYDGIEPAGRALFVTDVTQAGQPKSWPVVGNHPIEIAPQAVIESDGSAMILTQRANEIETTVRITLPSEFDAVELWEVTSKNIGDTARSLKIAPYLEWVLNTPAADRGHTQYNRLFTELSFDARQNALLAYHRYTKKIGVLAAATAPEGYLTSRMDFIGRAGSVWQARALETLAFREPASAEPCPSFDPAGSFLLGVNLAPGATAKLRFLIGCAGNAPQAVEWISRHLQPQPGQIDSRSAQRPRIGHGEIPPGTPQPYFEFAAGWDSLRVYTPFTPRPFHHTMANALGHVLCVTNRGLHSSASVNAQQNRLTTDWSDTVTSELPSEIFYLFDIGEQRWLSPTWLPLRDAGASYAMEFSVDGTATFHMTSGDLATELTTFVPPDEPAGFYLLTLRNNGAKAKKIRVAPYFRIALADQPENAGQLDIETDAASRAVYFTNRRNNFRTGPAFAAISAAPERIETCRGMFIGKGRSVAHPAMVEQGKPCTEETCDRAAIASFLITLEIPAGESRTISVLLGQSDTREQAAAVIHRCASVEAAKVKLAATLSWWRNAMGRLRVVTSNENFDGYLNWLKYQSLAERLWARKGFYQASGAFGFRDQLQDAVNLIWMNPAFARRQILLHGSQQFIEGDVAHWFFLTPDGRTGFAARSHASDNLLWLGWATAEYVRMTGDESILDAQLSYLESELPLAQLPAGKHGLGLFPHRSPQADNLCDHVLRAIDLVLKKRLGAHGLPLIGTGDWNDGLDEIGSAGRGESVWLGFFLHSILENLLDVIEKRKGAARRQHYRNHLDRLKTAIENTWRGDRYLRAIHDDGKEIGVAGSGVWEIDALTAAWAVISGINPGRGRVVFDTALKILERDKVILLGWPALREDSKPYLGRSCLYPEGVRENGMYCHGVQWLVRAARILAEQTAAAADELTAQKYRDTAIRLWRKIGAPAHTAPGEIEIYGGQPNQQAADLLTNYEPGRMIWSGYTGAAGWMLRQSFEGVIGAALCDNEVVLPADLELPRGDLRIFHLDRKVVA